MIFYTSALNDTQHPKTCLYATYIIIRIVAWSLAHWPLESKHDMLTMSLYINRWIENGKIDTTKERGLYQYREKEVNSDSEECLL